MRLAYIDYAHAERNERGCELHLEGRVLSSSYEYALERCSMPGQFRVMEVENGVKSGIGIELKRQSFPIASGLRQIELETAEGMRFLNIPQ